MTAVGRPDNAIAPNCFGHRHRNYGIVARGQRKHRAFKLVLCLSPVPIRQPIEPLVEASDVEGLRPGKACGAARAPKRLQRSAGIARDPTFQVRKARGSYVTGETVEALYADEGLVAAPSLFEQP